MSVVHDRGRVVVHHGDCLDVLRGMPAESVDSVVTDPPYGLEFMGKDWDSFRTYAGGNPAMKPQGTEIRPTEDGEWQPGRAYGSRQRNPRCQRCGKLARGNGACKCPEPRWDTRTAEGAFQYQAWCEEWAAECLRVLKPGGYLLAFGGTRTWHRLTCAIEDAGFEIRDAITWLYGSGFPKSLDVGKAIDKRKDWSALPLLQAKVKAARRALGISQSEAARRVGLIGPGESLGGGGFMWFETGMRLPTRAEYPRLKAALGLDDECDRAFVAAEREIVAERRVADRREDGTVIGLGHTGCADVTAPATVDAARWDGWGTALKPASEPIVVARKPLVGTVAANVLEHGTGALNIDACRVEHASAADLAESQAKNQHADFGTNPGGNAVYGDFTMVPPRNYDGTQGRWPSNVVLTHSPSDPEDGCEPSCPAAELDRQSGVSKSASRFFPTFRYQAKAGRQERPRILALAEWCACGHRADDHDDDGCHAEYGATDDMGPCPCEGVHDVTVERRWVTHPTVKPLDLMRWLVRLVTPPGGTGLDLFAGTGTTGEAWLLEGLRCVLIERDPESIPLILDRLTRRTDPVAHLTAKADRGEDVDLGLFALLDAQEDTT